MSYGTTDTSNVFGKNAQREIVYGEPTVTAGLVESLNQEVENLYIVTDDITYNVTNNTTNITNLQTDVTNNTTSITNLQTDITYLNDNAITSVTANSTWDSVTTPTPVDIFDSLTVTPTSAEFNFRPLVSSNGSINISYNPTSGVVNLTTASSGGGGSIPSTGDSLWESVNDLTLTDVLRPRIGSSSITGNETFLLGVQHMNTPGSSQLIFDASTSGAFRVGTYTGTQWNKVNLGTHSFACGADTIASGVTSFAAGNRNSVLGDAAAAFGTDNIADAPDVFVTGNANEVTGPSDGGFVGGGRDNSFTDLKDSAAIGASSVSGEVENTFITGTRAVCGVGSSGGTATAPIIGSFGAFDSSQDETHFLDKDYLCKMMYKNGFVRGGGSQTYDAAAPTVLGNDGAREVLLPARYTIAAGTTKVHSIPMEPGSIMLLRGNILVSATGNVARRACFEFDGGVFTRESAAPTVVMDIQPTIYENVSVPVGVFNINEFTFSTSGGNITISMTAPLTEPITVNLVMYGYDLR